MTGTPQNKHLEKIEDDQSIKGIDTLDDTLKNERGRHYFVSQEIKPSIEKAWYNPNTGRYVLGPFGMFTSESEFTSVSQQDLTLTCPAGFRYEVYYAQIINATQATSGNFTAVIGGNTFTSPSTTANGTSAIPILGSNASGSVSAYGAIGPICLDAGDTFTAHINTFAAGNDTEHTILYRSYRV